ncbi:MAG: glycosyltransferase, partial [Planctomycetota bacterium JB042]
MEVGIEYTLAARHAPGAGRYVRELVRALAGRDDRPALALYEETRRPAVLPAAALGLDGAADVRRCAVGRPRRLSLLASRFGLGPERRLGPVALFHHARVDGLVARSVPEVVPVAELPPAGSGDERAAAERLRRAARLLVFSSSMGERLVRLGIDEARVHRVPVGADHWARDLEAPPPRRDPPVVTVLGAVRPSRRHHVVLAACERLRVRGVEVRLDVLGRAGDRNGPFEAARAESPMRHAVRCEVPDETEIPARLAAASVVVQLEDDPGTPVTPLEAMALGVPVIASRAPAFVEALGDAARFVENVEAERRRRQDDRPARARTSSRTYRPAP